MQALFPVFAILGVAAGARLTLLPYAYLADPLPVYRQSQDTQTGVHAYSYAGGPSAKEEVRGLDGVTRGSYSYLDAHGFLQSVFYVADEDGFRVAATNLPTDGDLPRETGKILLARNAHLEDHTKAAGKASEGERETAEEQRASRRKRGLESVVANQDRSNQSENPSSRQDPADWKSPQAQPASPKNTHEQPPTPTKKLDEGQRGRDATGVVVAPVSGFFSPSALIPRLSGVVPELHQSRPEAVALPIRVPLATSHQNRIQVHNDRRIEAPLKLPENPQISAVRYQLLNALPLAVASPLDYNDNRIELHRHLGLEGSPRRNAVKIDAARLASFVEAPIATVPLVATEKVLPVAALQATAVSSQSRIQIHRNARLEVAVPVASEPTVYAPYVQPSSVHWPILAPVAHSSQYRSQIHSSEKIETAK